MAKTGRSAGSRKTTVSQRRVLTVLSSLVASLTVGAGLLMLLEGQPITSPVRSLSATTPMDDNFSRAIKPLVSLQPNRWNYIIIYQSNSLAGDASDLADGVLPGGQVPRAMDMRSAQERPKRVWPVDFHFVVDNGQNADQKGDGTVEVGSSWLAQRSTAPVCQWPNYRNHNYLPYKNAIGICVIGNLNVQGFSSNQVNSLAKLTRALQSKLSIPVSRVVFQWQITGHQTPAQAAFTRRFQQMLGR
ncbi:MAG: N-acetylmuramoyl-L-alanine amidase [Phycisphaerales bacterium]|nr:N-acetylmuramoyl-L-alanine amidase [Phycisphaerales bacterium]